MLDKVNIGDIIFANPEASFKTKANSILFVTGKREFCDTYEYTCQDIFTGAVHTPIGTTDQYISYADFQYMYAGYRLMVRAMHITSDDRHEASIIEFMNSIREAAVYINEMAGGVLLDRFTRRGFGVATARETFKRISEMEKLTTIEEIDEKNFLEASKVFNKVSESIMNKSE